MFSPNDKLRFKSRWAKRYHSFGNDEDNDTFEKEYPSQQEYLNQFLRWSFTNNSSSRVADEEMDQPSPDVMIHTSFHDYYLHKIFLSRSRYFRVLLRNGHWKQEDSMNLPTTSNGLNGVMNASSVKFPTEDRLYTIDFSIIESSIIPNEAKLNRQAFEEILTYLYTDHLDDSLFKLQSSSDDDEEEEYDSDEYDSKEPKKRKTIEDASCNAFQLLCQMIYLAKFLDLKQLIQQLKMNLDGIYKLVAIHYGHEESSSDSLQLPALNEYDYMEFALFVEQVYGRRYSEKKSDNLLNFPTSFLEQVCSQFCIPLSVKTKLLKEHLKQNFGIAQQPISESVLSHYRSVLSQIEKTSIERSFFVSNEQIEILKEHFGWNISQRREDIQKKLSSKSFNPSSILFSESCDEDNYPSEFVAPNTELIINVDSGKKSSHLWWSFYFNFHLDSEENGENKSSKTPRGAVFVSSTSGGKTRMNVFPLSCRDIDLHKSNDAYGLSFDMIVYIEPELEKTSNEEVFNE
ncbi:hypothetical protein C9374_009249 [Naegleria lovaniensis]|uniref:BTB domain-containing protein n=1 Tax=Naegleria lovaniensis TaxID=51637 RepID=A0AA88KH15_NAELO|nr:uncharacterized protein C9374_009249 [Naegleria lovaniensis]KAG2377338.1 hypothetical protein C9374_009249 [Naegleria lovaniensis]